MSRANTFGSMLAPASKPVPYQPMNLVLKSTDNKFNYDIELNDKLAVKRAIPLCLLYSVLLRCQLRALPRADILSPRLSLLLLVVIFPLHVNTVSNNKALAVDESMGVGG